MHFVPRHFRFVANEAAVTFDGCSPGMGPRVYFIARTYGRVVGWTSFPEPEAMQSVPPPANM